MLTIPIKNADAHLTDLDAPHAKQAKQIGVEEGVCTTLDSYIPQNPGFRPNLVKIDIEGAEVEALKDAINLLYSK